MCANSPYGPNAVAFEFAQVSLQQLCWNFALPAGRTQCLQAGAGSERPLLLLPASAVSLN